MATKDLPNPSSPFAEEGTFAHEVHEKILMGMTIDGLDLPPGMLDAVTVSTNYIHSLVSVNHPVDLLIEEYLPLVSLGVEGLEGGTADVVVVNYNATDRNVITSVEVVDYKHGRGLVEIEDCGQLMLYAIGVSLKFNLADTVPIRMTIAQPRAFHPDGLIRSDTLLVGELKGWLYSEVIPKAREAFSDSPTFITSIDGCRWCLMNGKCPAQVDQTLKVMANVAPFVVPPTGADELLANLPFIKTFIKTFESGVHDEVLNGSKDYPLLKIVVKKKNRKLKSDAGSILAKEYPDLVNDMFVRATLKSASQLEKIASIDNNLLRDLLDTSEVDELCVVALDDKRNEVVPDE